MIDDRERKYDTNDKIYMKKKITVLNHFHNNMIQLPVSLPIIMYFMGEGLGDILALDS